MTRLHQSMFIPQISCLTQLDLISSYSYSYLIRQFDFTAVKFSFVRGGPLPARYKTRQIS